MRNSLSNQVGHPPRHLRHLLHLVVGWVLACPGEIEKGVAAAGLSSGMVIPPHDGYIEMVEILSDDADVVQWLAPRRQPIPQNTYAYYHNQPGYNSNAPAYGMQNFAEPPPGMEPVVMKTELLLT